MKWSTNESRTHASELGMGFDDRENVNAFRLNSPNTVDSPYFSSPREHLSPSSNAREVPSPFGLALVQVAGGDKAILDALRAFAWSAYQEAGCPQGADEQGMDVWWTSQLTPSLS